MAHRRRPLDIAAVFCTQGLGWLLDHLGAPSPARFRRAPRGSELPTPVRLRLALEELGPTLNELVQISSTRDDLVPPDYIAELALLRNRVPAIPVEHIIAEIERSFGRPPDELFATFDPSPLV